ncbi:PAS domain S-box protein [Acetobacterium sp.]|uniref:PAS domain S-box protein n=1 Tax=Acetobacterium sp. TaxID=1872094 RepID=UPI00351D52E9
MSVTCQRRKSNDRRVAPNAEIPCRPTAISARTAARRSSLEQEGISYKRMKMQIDFYGNRFHIEDSATPVKDGDGAITGVVLIFRDISERTAQNERIAYLNYHDHLTGLYNRRYFEEELQRLSQGTDG